jgi:copper chaperone CopZ
MTIKTFLIEGMTCKNCKAFVERSIKTISGVDDVIADVTNGQVRISGDEIDIMKVKQLVEESGYRFKGEVNLHTARNSDVWLS